MPEQIENPHMVWPFHRDPASGNVAVVEQDTPEHIQSCELAIAACPLGFRQERPDFGWPWPEMKTIPLDPQPLVDALNRLEPRVSRRTASEYADLAGTATDRIIAVDDRMLSDV
jgi:phage baseplate assembly protein W